jgi:DNA-directed RNA polymerase subunit L
MTHDHDDIYVLYNINPNHRILHTLRYELRKLQTPVQWSGYSTVHFTHHSTTVRSLVQYFVSSEANLANTHNNIIHRSYLISFAP